MEMTCPKCGSGDHVFIGLNSICKNCFHTFNDSLEKLVKVPTAKLAKEKGFDLKLFRFFSNKTINSDSNIIPAPTQSLLQKWLREVHKIHIDTYIVEFPIGKIYWDFNLLSLEPNLDDSFLYNSSDEVLYKEGYKTYEETLEAGLVEALKLIQC